MDRSLASGEIGPEPVGEPAGQIDTQSARQSRALSILAAANAASEAGAWNGAAELYSDILRLMPEWAPAIWDRYRRALEEIGRSVEARERLASPVALQSAAAKRLAPHNALPSNGKHDAGQIAALVSRPESPVRAATEAAGGSAPDAAASDAAPAPQPGSLYCKWLWHAITVLCDGTVTCGLDDPFRSRNYGSVTTNSLREVFDRPAVRKRRDDLKAGTRCQGCHMYTTAADKSAETLKPSHPYPKILVLEPSIKCNIRCRNETCDIANDATIHVRREDFMPWPLFCKLIDEAGPEIDDLYFYNYGEPFVHPKALDMLAYAKKVNPALAVTTSTNGILLAREGVAERIVREDLVDWICFTIGGIDQETYVRYHKAGSFEKAMLGMRRLIEARRRAGKDKPVVHWRYLLFNWNDSDTCIEEALRLRSELGVDEFRFMLTASPMEGRSLRRAPGTPGFEAIKPWVAYQDDYSTEPFSEAGFWGAENNSTYGAFRWTGKQARFTLKPTENQIVVRLARSDDPMAPVPEAKIRLPWGEMQANIGVGRWGENTIAVPDAFLPEEVPIELEVDKLFAPIRHGNTSDNRELGLMVSMEGVSPATNPYRVKDTEPVRSFDLSR
ncbi:MAG TPA: SPASM domain-containing protein [Rhizomicrobium sp.]|nr:SPASM domain-containing protein [Rhizomicrobium sp.]